MKEVALYFSKGPFMNSMCPMSLNKRSFMSLMCPRRPVSTALQEGNNDPDSEGTA